LVTGAAGAVGRFGVQLARDLVGPKNDGQGAKVIAYGGGGDRDSRDEEFADANINHVSGQNVGEPYYEEDWVKEVQKLAEVDVVFDTVGGNVLEKSLLVVKDGGIVITVGTPIPKDMAVGATVLNKKGVEGHFFIVKESGEQLQKIADMLQTGKLRPAIGTTVEQMTEESVRNAWSPYNQPTRHFSGGIVVTVYTPPNARP